jgi:hypothetical protein
MNRSKDLLIAIKFCSLFGILVTSLDSHSMNPLRFTNRAQCAVDAENPTLSTFLILDSYNARKMIHNYAVSSSLSKPESLVSQAAKDYRLAITHNTLSVMRRILQGRLPLLPTDLSNSVGRAPKYKKLIAECSAKSSCPPLDQYLHQVWQASEINDMPTRLSRFSLIDDFEISDFFPRAKEAGRSTLLSCYLIKDFSALQSHLAKNQVGSQEIEQIAKAWLNKNDYITDCYDQSDQISNLSAVLQIEIDAKASLWDKVGFDFWNSTKIISTWAWRRAGLIGDMSPAFHRLFRAIALEESMMLIPNGCKSITPQRCDETTLTENSIREFAKIEPTHQDHSTLLPIGPEQILLKQKPPAVNEDILGIASEKSAADWVLRFRKQFTSARGISKNRIQTSLQILQRLSATVSSEVIKKGFERLLGLSREKNEIARINLYHSCQELRLSLDPRFNFYYQNIKETFESPGLTQLMQSRTQTPSALFNYLRSLTEVVLPICDLAANERLTEPPQQPDVKAGFRPWAQEALFPEKSVKNSDPGLLESQLRDKPLALWNASEGIVANNTLCYDESDCLRTVVESAISINAAMKYASAFQNSKSINSGSLFNPYAELAACKIYDPWMKTKKAYEDLFVGLINTALFGWNNTPIYIDVQRTLPKVTSLKKLVESGQVRFAPQIQESEIQATLFADFGPLIGVPCSLTITNQPKTPDINPYFFAGISLNYCDSKSEMTNRAYDAQNVQPDPQKNRGFCGACTLSFVSTESTANFYSGSPIAPVKFGIHLFRTISNFISTRKDSVNIPKQMTVEPRYAAHVLQTFGSIPESCVQQLGKGLSCYGNTCAARAAHAFEAAIGISVQRSLVFEQSPDSTNPSRFYAYLRTPQCDGEFRVPVICRNEAADAKDFEIQLDEVSTFEKDCQKHIPDLRNLL